MQAATAKEGLETEALQSENVKQKPLSLLIQSSYDRAPVATVLSTNPLAIPSSERYYNSHGSTGRIPTITYN